MGLDWKYQVVSDQQEVIIESVGIDEITEENKN